MTFTTRLTALFAVALIAATSSAASLALNYGWEDQDDSVYGTFGNITIDGVVTGMQNRLVANAAANPVTGASEGDYYLKVTETPHGGTPNAILGAVYGLCEGDTIDVVLDGWDETEAASPSIRVWFAQVDETGAFAGSAQSTFNGEFSEGTGEWNESVGSYTFDDLADFDMGEGIGIQLRIYSTPSTSDPNLTEFFVDNLQISVETNCSNPAASIALPNGTTVTVPEPASALGLICGLVGLLGFRRRK